MGVGEKMSARTVEIFLTCCLEGEARVITRILKKNKKTWTGKISSSSFNINSIDSSTRSGLMLACIKNSKEVVDLLLSRGDLDVNNQDGNTAEDFAAGEGNLDIVQIIREERSKRMGGVWTRPETIMGEDESESEDEEDMWKQEP